MNKPLWRRLLEGEPTEREQMRERLGERLGALSQGTAFEGHLTVDKVLLVDFGKLFRVRLSHEAAGDLTSLDQLSELNSLARQLTENVMDVTEPKLLWGSDTVFGSKQVAFLVPVSDLPPELQQAMQHHRYPYLQDAGRLEHRLTDSISIENGLGALKDILTRRE